MSLNNVIPLWVFLLEAYRGMEEANESIEVLDTQRLRLKEFMPDHVYSYYFGKPN